MFADYHVHTAYSDDSEYPMEEAVTDAIGLGMDEICFTDHVDYGIKRDWDDPAGMKYRPGGPGDPEQMAVANVDYPRYVEEIARLQDKYKGRIRIRLGLEFGMQVHTIPDYERLFKRYPLILSSCPFIRLKTGNSGRRIFRGVRRSRSTTCATTRRS